MLLLHKYTYGTHYVFAKPISNETDVMVVNVVDVVFTELTEKRFNPRFNVTEIQVAGPLKPYMTKYECKRQFKEPPTHRVNATEHVILPLKNHSISVLCSTDATWPVHLWDRRVTQAVITVNLLCTSQINAGKSSYHYLLTWPQVRLKCPSNGTASFKRHPLRRPHQQGLVRHTGHRHGVHCSNIWSLHTISLVCTRTEKAVFDCLDSELFLQHCFLPIFIPDEYADTVLLNSATQLVSYHQRPRESCSRKWKKTPCNRQLLERERPQPRGWPQHLIQVICSQCRGWPCHCKSPPSLIQRTKRGSVQRPEHICSRQGTTIQACCRPFIREPRHNTDPTNAILSCWKQDRW